MMISFADQIEFFEVPPTSPSESSTQSRAASPYDLLTKMRELSEDPPLLRVTDS